MLAGSGTSETSPRVVVTLLTVPDLSDLSERLLGFLRVLCAGQFLKRLGCAERLHSAMCLSFQVALLNLTHMA